MCFSTVSQHNNMPTQQQPIKCTLKHDSDFKKQSWKCNISFNWKLSLQCYTCKKKSIN